MDNSLPRSLDIDMSILTHHLSPIPFSTLALLRPFDILDAPLFLSGRGRITTRPPLDHILTEPSLTEPVCALLFPKSAVTEGFQCHVPVVILCHETGDGTTGGFCTGGLIVVVI